MSPSLARRARGKLRPLTARARDVHERLSTRLAHPPGHYYSPITSPEEIAARAAELWPPPPRELPGIDLNEAGQLELLARLEQFHDEAPFTDQPQAGFRYHYENDYYAAADGIVLYCMLRHLEPRRVIEFGSGFSSALMLDVNERSLERRVQLTFVDPNPQRLRGLLAPEDEAAVTVIAEPMQGIALEKFDALEAGDILFVDSSHVSKIGSDVNRVLFDVLPRLKAGVYIHVHDLFYPFEYPRGYVEKGWAWNEAYALRAFLQYNDSFSIALFPSYLEAFHMDELGKRLPLAVRHAPAWPEIRGASVWLRKSR